jgi:hypothetical protein
VEVFLALETPSNLDDHLRMIGIVVDQPDDDSDD